MISLEMLYDAKNVLKDIVRLTPLSPAPGKMCIRDSLRTLAQYVTSAVAVTFSTVTAVWLSLIHI